jgi:hypothetical protein
MADRDRHSLLAPLPVPPDPTALAREEELWAKVAADPGAEPAHKEYLGHILKNNLLKNASRRYTEAVAAKDRYTVEQRRLARQYQQQLMKILFLSAPPPKVETKGLMWRSVIYFFVAVLTLGGLFAFFADTSGAPAMGAALKLMFPFGSLFLGGSIWLRIRQTKSGRTREP